MHVYYVYVVCIEVKGGGHYFTFRAQKFAPCASLALFEISSWNFLYRLLKSPYAHIFQKNWEHLACARVSARVIRRLWLYCHFYWNDRIRLFFTYFNTLSANGLYSSSLIRTKIHFTRVTKYLTRAQFSSKIVNDIVVDCIFQAALKRFWRGLKRFATLIF